MVTSHIVITLRAAPELYQSLVREAKEAGMSLNRYCLRILDERTRQMETESE